MIALLTVVELDGTPPSFPTRRAAAAIQQVSRAARSRRRTRPNRDARHIVTSVTEGTGELGASLGSPPHRA